MPLSHAVYSAARREVSHLGNKNRLPQDILPELIAQLNVEYIHWNLLYKNGGTDPFWSDGVNLNLIRNHILYYKRELRELCKNNNLMLPEECHRQTPEEVSNNYMARPDEIKKDANEAYKVYCTTDIFQKLVSQAYRLEPAARQRALGIANYKSGCQQAIQDNDLISMRRYSPTRARQDNEAAEKFLNENSPTNNGGYVIQDSLFCF